MPPKVDRIGPETVDFEYHADYNEQDADLILVSSDGKGFRVHSLIMKLSSDVFRTMIDEGPLHDEHRKEPIHVQENANILKGLLDIIYPNRLSLGTSTPSFDSLREICHAAEKYEMSAVLNRLRVILWSMASTNSSLALPAFALASRCGWAEELRRLSTATLSIDLLSAESIEQLEAITSSDLLKLMALHRKRRNLLVACLNLGPPFTTRSISWRSAMYDASGCRCYTPLLKTPLLTVLRHRISEEMERRSDGASIRHQTFWDRSEFDGIWTTPCGNCSKTRRGLIDKNKLKDSVIQVLESLPKTI